MTLSEEREDNQLALPQSAGIGRRMIAFAMDFILLTFVAILIFVLFAGTPRQTDCR